MSSKESCLLSKQFLFNPVQADIQRRSGSSWSLQQFSAAVWADKVVMVRTGGAEGTFKGTDKCQVNFIGFCLTLLAFFFHFEHGESLFNAYS
nr:hypothetical protein [Salinisphaera sp. G21_0]